SIRAEFMRQRMEQFIIDEKPAANHIIFNDRILEWDTADFIVKYLGEKIDTTTKVFELINATTVDKEKIIKLINETKAEDVKNFAKQIKSQLTDDFFVQNKMTRGESKTTTSEVSIEFSQPLISSDYNTIILKEWSSTGDCWIKAISVYKRTAGKW